MELKDWLNSINFTKEDLREHAKQYPPYIVNRCLSEGYAIFVFAKYFEEKEEIFSLAPQRKSHRLRMCQTILWL
jgi:hypothetical protein